VKLFQELQTLDRRFREYEQKHPFHDLVVEEVVAEWRRAFPRKRNLPMAGISPDFDKIASQLGAAKFEQIVSPYRKRADALFDSIDKSRKELSSSLMDLARKADIRAGKAWRVYRSIWLSTYSNQTAPERYAEKLAEVLAIKPEKLGINTRVVASKDVFHVRVQVFSTFDLEILQRKPDIEVEEFVQECWDRAVDPRVYNPFIDDEVGAYKWKG
jgi:hypothetical protein